MFSLPDTPEGRLAVSFEYKCRVFSDSFYLTLEIKGSLKVACKFVQNVPDFGRKGLRTGSCSYANHKKWYLMQTRGPSVYLWLDQLWHHRGYANSPCRASHCTSTSVLLPSETSCDDDHSHFIDRKGGLWVTEDLSRVHFALNGRPSWRLPSFFPVRDNLYRCLHCWRFRTLRGTRSKSYLLPLLHSHSRILWMGYP